jgi:hypothetical protein
MVQDHGIRRRIVRGTSLYSSTSFIELQSFEEICRMYLRGDKTMKYEGRSNGKAELTSSWFESVFQNAIPAQTRHELFQKVIKGSISICEMDKQADDINRCINVSCLFEKCCTSLVDISAGWSYPRRVQCDK